MSDDIKSRLAKQGLAYWLKLLPKHIASKEELTRRMMSADVVERDWQNLLDRRWRRIIPVSDLHCFYGVAVPSYREIWIAYPKQDLHHHFIMFDASEVACRITVLELLLIADDPPRCVGWAEILVAGGKPLSETFNCEHATTQHFIPVEEDGTSKKLLNAGLELMVIQMGAALTHFARGYVRVEKPKR